MTFRSSLASFLGSSAGFCRQSLLLTACALAGIGFAQAGIVGLWEFNDPADLGKATAVVPGTPVCEIRSSGSGKSANITFLRRYETPVLDVEYRVELSDSPTGPWLGNIIPAEVRSLDQYWQEVSIPLPLSSSKRARFGRVSVIPKSPPPP